MADRVSRRGKRKTAHFLDVCCVVWIIVFYFYNIFLTISYASYIKHGYKRFSKTNSSDPRQRVLLKAWTHLVMFKDQFSHGCITGAQHVHKKKTVDRKVVEVARE